MDLGPVRALADALLYEGYVLYPYRASAPKNRSRFTFGSLLPRAWAEVRGGGEPFRLESQCLVRASGACELEAKARFLQLVRRSGAASPAGEPWDEGAPREIDAGPFGLAELGAGGRRRRFSLAARRVVEGGVAREQAALEGEIELVAEGAGEGLYRLYARVANLTPLGVEATPADANLRSLASTHLVLGVRGGEFVSLQDPPPGLEEAAGACANGSAWPVLVGRPGAGDLLLCSPIVLYDYPALAPESPGDFFDATEIDEMLVLRILTLTDGEKRQMAATDERARALLERAESLGPEGLLRLHGALRSPGRSAGGGVAFAPGDRVVLRPRQRADAIDLVLAGRDATVVAVERDYEDRVHVAVTVDDDPGADLGAEGKIGHRFFFGPDEVERRAGEADAPREGAPAAPGPARPGRRPGVLVAGIGNLFFGDDGFGTELARALLGRALPEGVRVVDFGIRGLDLAYALEEYDAAILLDATPRGGAPGTLYVLEPEVDHRPELFEAHSLTPERVLASLPAGARPRALRVVGCEPLTLEPDEAGGLSAPVRAALEEALCLVEDLARRLLTEAGRA
ncbi:MAG TPA: hydrogenase maturation protease [Polyangiaceae bacterium]|nr:hydrogenase maturation protease [Polyangiaceae bacterium]